MPARCDTIILPILADGAVASVTTPFDMTARNDLERFNMAIDMLDRLTVSDDRADITRQCEGRVVIRAHLATAMRSGVVNSSRPIILRRYPP